MSDVKNTLRKWAEASGSHLQPYSADSRKPIGKRLASVPKVADTGLDPHVDVTGAEAPKTAAVRRVGLYALPSKQKYPLDDYGQVKMAAAYFDEHSRAMPLEDRREYCQNLSKRANALNIPYSNLIASYASDDWGEDEEVKIALDLRRQLLTRDDELNLLDRVEAVKEASGLGPEDFTYLLHEFDVRTGLDAHYDQDIPDPYISTFGMSKTAEAKEDDDEAFVIGNDYVTKEDLARLSLTRRENLEKTFGDDFVKEFSKDPGGIFSSLPAQQKKMLARMAASNAPGSDHLF